MLISHYIIIFLQVFNETWTIIQGFLCSKKVGKGWFIKTNTIYNTYKRFYAFLCYTFKIITSLTSNFLGYSMVGNWTVNAGKPAASFGKIVGISLNIAKKKCIIQAYDCYVSVNKDYTRTAFYSSHCLKVTNCRWYMKLAVFKMYLASKYKVLVFVRAPFPPIKFLAKTH